MSADSTEDFGGSALCLGDVVRWYKGPSSTAPMGWSLVPITLCSSVQSETGICVCSGSYTSNTIHPASVSAVMPKAMRVSPWRSVGRSTLDRDALFQMHKTGDQPGHVLLRPRQEPVWPSDG
ncbi:unnamed protein product [Clonostachys rhizophaga]|uniref:Uncharacterized protein n=1 Tax=Clonostachys rhizophaga TaxID=160324 RepID=A0A9N9YHX7_9HYPO|nr:unnamed protein product [Clonostachys rhizophaga]